MHVRAFTSTVSPRIRMCQKTGRVGREENKNKQKYKINVRQQAIGT